MSQHPYSVSPGLFILIDAHLHFSLQNSKDNMSVVLVTFPNAPKASQDAIAKVGSRLGEETSWANVCVCMYVCHLVSLRVALEVYKEGVPLLILV